MERDNNSLMPDKKILEKNKRLNAIVLFLMGFMIVIVAFVINSLYSQARLSWSVISLPVDLKFFSWIAMSPIWFVVFISIFAKQKRKGKSNISEQNMIFTLIIVGLVFMVAAGFFLLVSRAVGF